MKLNRLKNLLWTLVILFLGVISFELVSFGGGIRKFASLAGARDVGKENRLPPYIGKSEAIVVLAGDRHRIPKALELLRTRGTPLLIIAGAKRGTSLKQIVNTQGDAANSIHETWERIVVESHSQTTIENAYEAGKILRKRNVNRVILVTSEYHMRRALKIFRKVMADVTFYPYPVLSDVSQAISDPSGRVVTGIWYAWNEFWKCINYRWVSSFRIRPLPPLVEPKK